MFINSRLKVTKIIGQRKAFYRHRISESSCTRTETVDTDIFVTSRNGDRKIMQSIRIDITNYHQSMKYIKVEWICRDCSQLLPKLTQT